jgi:pimeloyl-ACP methyl ester carboxylesterase
VSPVPYFEKVEVAGRTHPWLTMVHGMSQDRRVFSAQVGAFEKDYRVLLVDLPGHGNSSAMSGPYGPEEYAAATLAALDAAGVEVTHFWGTHTGAGVGLSLATRQPRRFESLILEGAVMPGVVVPSVARTIDRAKATARERGVEAARREWFEDAEWFDVIRREPERCRARAYRSLLAEFRGAPWLDPAEPTPVEPVRGTLHRIVAPTLLINGEHDVPDFVTMAEELASTLPIVERRTIPGAGGFPLWEDPAAVNAHVTHFLATLRRKAGSR